MLQWEHDQEDVDMAELLELPHSSQASGNIEMEDQSGIGWRQDAFAEANIDNL